MYEAQIPVHPQVLYLLSHLFFFSVIGALLWQKIHIKALPPNVCREEDQNVLIAEI
jgi:hypothetical protein